VVLTFLSLIIYDFFSFLHGFLGNISRPCILRVEVLDLYHGLKLCWGSGYRRVLCLSYSSIVVDFVQKG